MALPTIIVGGDKTWLRLNSITVNGVDVDSTTSPLYLRANVEATFALSVTNVTGAYAIDRLGFCLEWNNGDKTWLLGSDEKNVATVTKIAKGATRTLTFTIVPLLTGNASGCTLVGYGRHTNTTNVVSGRYALPNLAYQHRFDFPQITEFHVDRAATQSTSINLRARGTRENSFLTESVELWYKKQGDASWVRYTPNFTAAQLLAGIDTTLNIELETTKSCDFQLIFFNEYERAESGIVTVLASFANVHLAGYESGGVAFGRFSSAEEGNPLFECDYPAVMYRQAFLAGGLGFLFDEDIELPDNSLFVPYAESEGVYSGVHCRWNGSTVELYGTLSKKTSATSSATLWYVCTLPEQVRPDRQINVLCQGSNTYVFMLRVDVNGDVNITRYRSGSSYGTVNNTTWLPFHVVWELKNARYTGTIDTYSEVLSVNGMRGNVILNASHVGAATPSDVEEVRAEIGSKADKSEIPDISGKQDKLVSGTSIKTINGESLLGSGNITIQGGGGGAEEKDYTLVIDDVLTDAVTQYDVSDLISARQYTDIIAIISTTGNSATGSLRCYAYSSGAESSVGYITLSNAIGTNTSMMYATFRVWKMGGVWNNEGAAGTVLVAAQSYAPNRFKKASSGAYIRRFYITATTANVPIPSGATIKVYAR